MGNSAHACEAKSADDGDRPSCAPLTFTDKERHFLSTVTGKNPHDLLGTLVLSGALEHVHRQDIVTTMSTMPPTEKLSAALLDSLNEDQRREFPVSSRAVWALVTGSATEEAVASWTPMSKRDAEMHILKLASHVASRLSSECMRKGDWALNVASMEEDLYARLVKQKALSLADLICMRMLCSRPEAFHTEEELQFHWRMAIHSSVDMAPFLDNKHRRHFAASAVVAAASALPRALRRVREQTCDFIAGCAVAVACRFLLSSCYIVFLSARSVTLAEGNDLNTSLGVLRVMAQVRYRSVRSEMAALRDVFSEHLSSIDTKGLYTHPQGQSVRELAGRVRRIKAQLDKAPAVPPVGGHAHRSAHASRRHPTEAHHVHVQKTPERKHHRRGSSSSSQSGSDTTTASSASSGSDSSVGKKKGRRRRRRRRGGHKTRQPTSGAAGVHPKG